MTIALLFVIALRATAAVGSVSSCCSISPATARARALDGVNKMSKSLDNYIGITEAPSGMFGKLMSISDTLMWRYYELLSFRPMPEIAALKLAFSEIAPFGKHDRLAVRHPHGERIAMDEVL